MTRIVTVIPTSKRAKERIKRHGSQMKLITTGVFRGDAAIHVESLEETYSCEGVKMKWGGWFTDKEIDIKATLNT